MGNKDMNEKIARMAFGHTLEEEYLLFGAKAKTIHRTIRCIHRCYIPNKCQEQSLALKAEKCSTNQSMTFLSEISGVIHPIQ